MNFLEERILKDGIVKSGNVLKVDSFLNHQMDISLMEQIGQEFKRRFGHKTVTKVLTIEASGIGIAAFVAREFGVPMVFAKKSKSINLDGDMFVAEVESFTHKNKNQIIVSRKFLHEGEHVLIIDDFLANGCALQGLISIAEWRAAASSLKRASSMAAVPSGIWAIRSNPWPLWMPWTRKPVPSPSVIREVSKGQEIGAIMNPVMPGNRKKSPSVGG